MKPAKYEEPSTAFTTEAVKPTATPSIQGESIKTLRSFHSFEIRDDFQRIVYAANADAARTGYAGFERTWNKRWPSVVASLREGGEELLTVLPIPTRPVEDAANPEYG